MIICAIMVILLGIVHLAAAKEPFVACIRPYHWETTFNRIEAGTIGVVFALTGLLLIGVGIGLMFTGK